MFTTLNMHPTIPVSFTANLSLFELIHPIWTALIFGSAGLVYVVVVVFLYNQSRRLYYKWLLKKLKPSATNTTNTRVYSSLNPQHDFNRCPYGNDQCNGVDCKGSTPKQEEASGNKLESFLGKLDSKMQSFEQSLLDMAKKMELARSNFSDVQNGTTTIPLGNGGTVLIRNT